MYRHVVLYGWKPSLSLDKIAAVYQELDEISAKLPGRLSYTWGTNVSEQGIAKGYTHCLVTDFVDKEARDLFINDPARKALSLNKVVPNMVDGINSVISFDFICED